MAPLGRDEFRPSFVPPMLSLLGPSGAGKTTLAVELVARWRAAGLRVGYVKHASHGFQMDRPGKDSCRVAEAGADGIAVTGPGGLAFLDRGDPWDPAEIAVRLFADRDVVVLEGFREAGYPAVVLAGDRPAVDAVSEARGPLIAVVAGADGLPAAVAASRGAPAFSRSDTAGLLATLDAWLGVFNQLATNATP